MTTSAVVNKPPAHNWRVLIGTCCARSLEPRWQIEGLTVGVLAPGRWAEDATAGGLRGPGCWATPDPSPDSASLAEEGESDVRRAGRMVVG